MFSTLRYILNHPVNRGRPIAALSRYFRWQIGSRVLRHPAVVPFTDHARLVVATSMRGATGNVYCGLHEFADMGFVVHFLRPDDLFIDIGANVGTYTVLASKICGATTVAVEPIPVSYDRLLDNIAVNHIRDKVTPVRGGLGREPGVLRFTSGLDTMNYAVPQGMAAEGETIDVPVTRLDDLAAGRSPSFIKMDVEGFEAEVVAGGMRTLASPQLQGVILETITPDNRYRADGGSLHRTMSDFGFRPFVYHPRDRRLEAVGPPTGGNTLYLRDPGGAIDRVRSAKPVSVFGRSI